MVLSYFLKNKKVGLVPDFFHFLIISINEPGRIWKNASECIDNVPMHLASVCFHSALDISVRISLCDGVALVIELFTLAESKCHFDV